LEVLETLFLYKINFYVDYVTEIILKSLKTLQLHRDL